MVMEYLEGGDLAAWLDRAGRAARRAGRRLRAPGLRGDRRGARAGDRSPRPQAGEPLLHPAPRRALVIKVLDFGISKALGRAGGSLSDHPHDRGHGLAALHVARADAVVQGRRRRAPTSGLSASSCTSCVTGRRAVRRRGITELVLRIVTAQPPLVAAMLPGIPPGLDPIIQRCLAKNRDHRYASVAEMANNLLPLGSPSARLSVERIGNIMGAAGQPARKNFHSSPPGVHATQQMGGSQPSITGAGGGGMPQPQAAGTLPRMTDAAWGQTGGAPPPPRQGPKQRRVHRRVRGCLDPDDGLHLRHVPADADRNDPAPRVRDHRGIALLRRQHVQLVPELRPGVLRLVHP